MRRNIVAAVAIMSVVVNLPTGMAQRGGPPSSSGFFSDPAGIFQKLANDRSYFLISETRMLREPLLEWAKRNGISDEKITREQFNAAWPVISEQMKSRFGGGRPSGPPPGASPPAPSSSSGSSSPSSSSTSSSSSGDVKQLAESEFKRRDDNNDGKLNRDEMGSTLRGELARWDSTKDELIDFNEYLVYFQIRTQREQALTIIIEDDLDKRPVVYRAGKLPKELPSWFADLDIDTDGQVSLYEWRRPRRDVEEFQKYDRNDDGFLTAEEMLRQINGPQTASKSPAPGMVTTIIAAGSGPNSGSSGFTGAGGGFGGFRGGGPPGGGFGGFRGGNSGPAGGSFGGFRGGSGGPPGGGFGGFRGGSGGTPGGGFGGFRGGKN